MFELRGLSLRYAVDGRDVTALADVDISLVPGVAGFYGRGANPPPTGASVIHVLGPRRVPVDFECRPAVGGRLLVHAGVDLWGFSDATSTARRIVPQLFDWIAAGGDATP